jgi:hypothetical protein
VGKGAEYNFAFYAVGVAGGEGVRRLSSKFEIFHFDSDISVAYSNVNVGPLEGSYGPR